MPVLLLLQRLFEKDPGQLPAFPPELVKVPLKRRSVPDSERLGLPVEAAAAEREALLAKLKEGKASPDELQ
jgi:hypothetical protein